eukprot:7350669-Pyramimonas_sp.AAC.1
MQEAWVYSHAGPIRCRKHRPGGAERSFRRRAAGAPREAAGGADAGTGDDARVRGPAAAAGVELKQTRGRCAAR